MIKRTSSSKAKFSYCALCISIKKQNKIVYKTDVAAVCIESVISEDTDNITSRDMEHKRAVEHVLDTHPLSRLKLLFIQPASVSMKSSEQVCFCVHENMKANCPGEKH